MSPAKLSPAKQKVSQRPSTHRTDTASHTDLVDPRWLLRALSLSLGAALLCAWLAACLLVHQGLWQLLLHPSPTVDRNPANAGIAFTPIRFADFDTGQPHLTGWWVPAQPAGPASAPSPYSRLTILYLHGGSGSLSDALPDLELLHSIGLNVFAIDYRGFGASDSSLHPSAERMQQDAAAALDYLLSTRHLPLDSIIPMGSGLGAPLAVTLAHNAPQLPAIILDNPDPDPAATAAAFATKLVPVRWLFGRRFAIAAPLAALSTPKLLIAGGPGITPAQQSRIEDLYRHAADPKYSVSLPPAAPNPARTTALRRFLDDLLADRPGPAGAGPNLAGPSKIPINRMSSGSRRRIFPKLLSSLEIYFSATWHSSYAQPATMETVEIFGPATHAQRPPGHPPQFG